MGRLLFAFIAMFAVSRTPAFAQLPSLLPLGPSQLAYFAGLSGWIGEAVGVLVDVDVPYDITTNLI
jgi:hypothetical protein